MADENKNENKDKKGGYTVAEIEGKMKKFGKEIVFGAMFILTGLFALIFGGAWMVWSILLCMIGAIVGVLAPQPIDKALASMIKFAHREKVTAMIAAGLGIVISIFLPFLIFGLVGLAGGKSLYLDTQKHTETGEKTSSKPEKSSSDSEKPE